jgi:hydrogenase expression/formation protein HypC
MCLAVPAQIKTMYADGSSTVDLAGVERRISLVMTPEAQIGDYVLVHTGFAISVLDLDEARETLRFLLEELAACAAEEEASDEVY